MLHSTFASTKPTRSPLPWLPLTSGPPHTALTAAQEETSHRKHRYARALRYPVRPLESPNKYKGKQCEPGSQSTVCYLLPGTHGADTQGTQARDTENTGQRPGKNRPAIQRTGQRHIEHRLEAQGTQAETEGTQARDTGYTGQRHMENRQRHREHRPETQETQAISTPFCPWRGDLAMQPGSISLAEASSHVSLSRKSLRFQNKHIPAALAFSSFLYHCTVTDYFTTS